MITSRPSEIAMPPAPRPTGLRRLTWTSSSLTPLEETRSIIVGSWGSTSRTAATSSPRRSRAPTTIASSTSPSAARCTIDRWMRERRSSSAWRSSRDSRRRTFSAAWRSLSSRSARSSSSPRSSMRVSERTRAIPRRRIASSRLKPSSSRRASTSTPESSSREAVSTGQSPTPGTGMVSASPRAAAKISASGTSPAVKPIDATTWSRSTIAPASASIASAARSTAMRLALASSSHAETSARNSVSC